MDRLQYVLCKWRSRKGALDFHSHKDVRSHHGELHLSVSPGSHRRKKDTLTQFRHHATPVNEKVLLILALKLHLLTCLWSLPQLFGWSRPFFFDKSADDFKTKLFRAVPSILCSGRPLRSEVCRSGLVSVFLSPSDHR